MQPRASKFAWGCLYALAALLVAYFFLHYNGSIVDTLAYYPKADFQKMVNGTADKPYVGRMLVPNIIHIVDQITPSGVQQAFSSIFISRALFGEFEASAYQRAGIFPFTVAVYLVLVPLMFFGIGLGARAAFREIYGQGGTMANGAGVLFVLAIPLWFRYIAYMYDPMTILLGTWIIYSVFKRRHWLTIILFILACLNKETAPLYLPFILFVPIRDYLKDKRQSDLFASIILGVVLAIAAALIQVFRRSYFEGNPSSWTESHWQDHQMIVFQEYTFSVLYAAVVMTAMLYLACRDWRTKPVALRFGMLTVLIPLFIASLVWGYLDETRALFDAWPFVALLGLPTLFQLLQFRPAEPSAA